MDLHANAVLAVRQRQRVCDLVVAGVTVSAAALVVGCSRQTASKWVNRWRRGESLYDRSSRPQRSPRQTSRVVEQAILCARAELREGPRVIGWALGIAASTVHAVLRRHGRSRLVARRAAAGDRPLRALSARASSCMSMPRSSDASSSPATASPAIGRGQAKARPAGSTCSWQSTTTRGSASPASIPTRRRRVRFLSSSSQLVRFYGAHGISVERVLTDNGTCFKRRRADACAGHRIAVRKTRAYRPQTNGKAERFIRTLLERWAYAYPYARESTVSPHSPRRSTSTIVSVPTAPLVVSRRFSASTTSLGHTARLTAGSNRRSVVLQIA